MQPSIDDLTTGMKSLQLDSCYAELPMHTLERCFSFLGRNEARLFASLSRRFVEIAFNPSQLATKMAKAKWIVQDMDPQLQKFLKQLGKYFRFLDCKHVEHAMCDEAFPAIGWAFPRLECLTMKFLESKKLSDTALSHLKGLPLREFRCFQTGLTTGCFPYLRPFPLEVLEIERLNITKKEIACLEGKKLRTLSIPFGTIEPSALFELQFFPLKELDVNCVDLQNAHMMQFVPLELTSLRIGNASHFKNTDMVFLHGLPLKTLCFDYMQFNHTALCLLLKTVRHLELTACRNILDDGMQHLQNLPLHTLNITDTPIKEAGFRILGSMKIQEIILPNGTISSSKQLRKLYPVAFTKSMNESLHDFVSDHLKPYLEGRFSKDTEKRDRKPLIDSLYPHFREKFPRIRIDKEHLEKEASKKYAFIGATAFVHLKGYYVLEHNTNDAQQFFSALTAAVKIDFRTMKLSIEEIKKIGAQALSDALRLRVLKVTSL